MNKRGHIMGYCQMMCISSHSFFWRSSGCVDWGLSDMGVNNLFHEHSSF